LQSGQQLARRDRDNSSDDPGSKRAVTDLPPKVWSTSDNDSNDSDSKAGDTTDAAEKNDRSWQAEGNAANDIASQFLSNEGEMDGMSPVATDDSSPQDTIAAGQQNLTTTSGTQTNNPRNDASDLGDWLRSTGADSSQLSQKSLAEIAKGIKKKKDERAAWVKIEQHSKLINISMLGFSFAILPVIKYAGNLAVAAANRRAGFLSQISLPGYRPLLPKGVKIDTEEQSWNLALDFELFTAFMGLFVIFMAVIGILIFLYFYYFGPILAVISAFCSIFSSACSR
jgi:hypothetical protein